MPAELTGALRCPPNRPEIARLSRRLAFAAIALAWATLAAVAWAGAGPALDWRFAVEDPAVAARARALPPLFEVLLDYRKTDGHAHSPSLFEAPDGSLTALWFDGSREGATDVVIARRLLRGPGGSPADKALPPIADADAVEAALRPAQTVRKLGNTVIAAAAGAVPLLFVTTVSYGGWAMSKVAALPLDAGGLPGPGRHLALSPLFNRSALVRAPVIGFADGTIGLPLYQEQAGRFGELVRLDGEGRVVAKARISHGRRAIQPVVAVLDERRAVAFLRNFSGARDRLLAARTEDGGRSWSALETTDLASFNSPAAALTFADGTIALAYTEGVRRRDRMVLALSHDGGRTFRPAHVLEDGATRPGDARYPTMIRLRDGSIALIYSVLDRGGIRALRFSEAWAEAELARAGRGAAP